MFKVQVRIKEYNAGAWIHVFRDMRPSGGAAYEFTTLDAARRAVQLSNDGARTRDDFRIVNLTTNTEESL